MFDGGGTMMSFHGDEQWMGIQLDDSDISDVEN